MLQKENILITKKFRLIQLETTFYKLIKCYGILKIEWLNGFE